MQTAKYCVSTTANGKIRLQEQEIPRFGISTTPFQMILSLIYTN